MQDKPLCSCYLFSIGHLKTFINVGHIYVGYHIHTVVPAALECILERLGSEWDCQYHIWNCVGSVARWVRRRIIRQCKVRSHTTWHLCGTRPTMRTKFRICCKRCWVISSITAHRCGTIQRMLAGINNRTCASRRRLSCINWRTCTRDSTCIHTSSLNSSVGNFATKRRRWSTRWRNKRRTSGRYGRCTSRPTRIPFVYHI